MKVYILRVGHVYSELNIISVFDSLNKAKNFCVNEYGIEFDDWTYSEENEHYFYDTLEERELKTNYTEFVIDVKNVL